MVVHRQHDELLPGNLCKFEEPVNQYDFYSPNSILINNHFESKNMACVTRHSLSGLKAAWQVFHRRVQSLRRHVVSLEPINDHHGNWRPPFGVRVTSWRSRTQWWSHTHTRAHSRHVLRSPWLTSAWLKHAEMKAVWCEMCWAEQKATEQTYLSCTYRAQQWPPSQLWLVWNVILWYR